MVISWIGFKHGIKRIHTRSKLAFQLQQTICISFGNIGTSLF